MGSFCLYVDSPYTPDDIFGASSLWTHPHCVYSINSDVVGYNTKRVFALFKPHLCPAPEPLLSVGQNQNRIWAERIPAVNSRR